MLDGCCNAAFYTRSQAYVKLSMLESAIQDYKRAMLVDPGWHVRPEGACAFLFLLQALLFPAPRSAEVRLLMQTPTYVSSAQLSSPILWHVKLQPPAL
eukprot:scaffold32361_cov19-Tisochrysis_lutea.AAC.1